MDHHFRKLKRLNARPARIEQKIVKTKLHDRLNTSHYSCVEVAEPTQDYSVSPLRIFTLRLTSNDRRIPQAEKSESGTWQAPREAVPRIMSGGNFLNGVPVKRRMHLFLGTLSPAR